MTYNSLDHRRISFTPLPARYLKMDKIDRKKKKKCFVRQNLRRKMDRCFEWNNFSARDVPSFLPSFARYSSRAWLFTRHERLIRFPFNSWRSFDRGGSFGRFIRAGEFFTIRVAEANLRTHVRVAHAGYAARMRIDREQRRYRGDGGE